MPKRFWGKTGDILCVRPPFSYSIFSGCFVCTSIKVVACARGVWGGGGGAYAPQSHSSASIILFCLVVIVVVYLYFTTNSYFKHA